MFFFFFDDPATTEIYTLSLHDALPISKPEGRRSVGTSVLRRLLSSVLPIAILRSEEHTSELQSRQYLVCRLLLEKKKNKYKRLGKMQVNHNVGLLFITMHVLTLRWRVN